MQVFPLVLYLYILVWQLIYLFSYFLYSKSFVSLLLQLRKVTRREVIFREGGVLILSCQCLSLFNEKSNLEFPFFLFYEVYSPKYSRSASLVWFLNWVAYFPMTQGLSVMYSIKNFTFLCSKLVGAIVIVVKLSKLSSFCTQGLMLWTCLPHHW